MGHPWCSCCSQTCIHSMMEQKQMKLLSVNDIYSIYVMCVYMQCYHTHFKVHLLNTYITLDDIGFLGQVQQHTVIGEVVVGVDAPIPSHTCNSLGLLGLRD